MTFAGGSTGAICCGSGADSRLGPVPNDGSPPTAGSATGAGGGSVAVTDAAAGAELRLGEAVGRSRAGAGAMEGAGLVVRGAVAAGAGVVSGAVWPGRVTAPLMVKSRSSRGPTVSGGGGVALLVAGAVVS